MCLTETWHQPEVNSALNEACPPGYSYVEAVRSTGRGGGLAVIHQQDLELSPISLPATSSCKCLAFKNSRGHTLLPPTQKPKRQIHFRKLKNINAKALALDLQRLSSGSTDFLSVADSVDFYNQFLSSLLDLHAPLTYRKKWRTSSKKIKLSTCALDPFPTALLKANISAISPFITKIINYSLLRLEKRVLSLRKRRINFHCYADDTQLYLSIKPEETNRVDKLLDCLKDIKAWMTYNFLLLNSEKTEVIILGPKHLRETLSDHIVTLDGITLASSSTVRNLGVTFDQDMSFDSHIKQVSRTAFFHLRNIKNIRNILSQKDAEKLVHAFVTSRLDYCNSLLLGCPNKSVKSLQLIQNAAARVLTRTRKRDHISPVLESLHWLPVKFRIEFKILLLTYKALNNQAPSYLTELLVSYYPNRSLRSVNAGLLVVPRVCKSRMGGRAFSHQAPLLWNQLPVCVRDADTLSTFKVKLKTFLFDKAYS
ncbi:uncharacterized protein LOC118286550 [Scophthalmus maximus]|uniref:uncharacterized protein LOC118286550 n=1 Tax=Scophthalmus maximus TaxID=52904 RepID=UPI001FA92670|nr:uncharacterized protein LOC118286550 [Scophthalmus maximus]